jgi:hypothetical protein
MWSMCGPGVWVVVLACLLPTSQCAAGSPGSADSHAWKLTVDGGCQTPLRDFGLYSPFGAPASSDLWTSHKTGVRFGGGAKVELGRVVALVVRTDYARLPFDRVRFKHERYYSDHGLPAPTVDSPQAAVSTRVVGLEFRKSTSPAHPYLTVGVDWATVRIPAIDVKEQYDARTWPAMHVAGLRTYAGFGIEYHQRGSHIGYLAEIDLMGSGLGPIMPLRFGVSWQR